jgi:hypothetical protein
MDNQTIINTLLFLVSFFGGLWVRGIADSMKELKKTDADLAAKVQGIEVLVAGKYVQREELKSFEEALFRKLDRIEEKLDLKMDKE